MAVVVLRGPGAKARAEAAPKAGRGGMGIKIVRTGRRRRGDSMLSLFAAIVFCQKEERVGDISVIMRKQDET